MLDDEEHLVVMRRRRQGTLLRQQLRQAQIAGISQAACKVGHDSRFERSLVFVHFFFGCRRGRENARRKLSITAGPGRHTSLRKTFQPDA